MQLKGILPKPLGEMSVNDQKAEKQKQYKPV
jgi:hypothetical protein